MVVMDAVKFFIGRFIMTRAELPEYMGMYSKVENQGNIMYDPKECPR